MSISSAVGPWYYSTLLHCNTQQKTLVILSETSVLSVNRRRHFSDSGLEYGLLESPRLVLK